MLNRLTPSWRNAILITLGVLALWFCWSVRAVLNPLIAAYFLAYVVHPMVLRLERRGFSRRAAVNVIFIGALLSSALVLGMVFVQGRGLVKEVIREDGLMSKVEERLDTFVGEHEDKFQWLLDKLRDEEASEEEAASATGEESRSTSRSSRARSFSDRCRVWGARWRRCDSGRKSGIDSRGEHRAFFRVAVRVLLRLHNVLVFVADLHLVPAV